MYGNIIQKRNWNKQWLPRNKPLCDDVETKPTSMHFRQASQIDVKILNPSFHFFSSSLMTPYTTVNLLSSARNRTNTYAMGKSTRQHQEVELYTDETTISGAVNPTSSWTVSEHITDIITLTCSEIISKIGRYLCEKFNLNFLRYIINIANCYHNFF